MNLLIFDMDGVLLKPQGYHRALRETVRIGTRSSGFGEKFLSDEQIARFEALGISSEWHSSALCMAVLALQNQGEISEVDPTGNIQLEELFDAIAAQPMGDPEIIRSLNAVISLADKTNPSFREACDLVERSKSIPHSATHNLFQELILGSELFSKTYQKPAQLQTESYLNLFDQRLISEAVADQLINWVINVDHGASIMTNRPSGGPNNFKTDPDAAMGAGLVGLFSLPLVGGGEVSWLAAQTQRDEGELSKPSWPHALAAILTASGWSLEESLDFVIHACKHEKIEGLNHLTGSKITVFEDTPAGLIAVKEAGALLDRSGFSVEVQLIGISEDSVKKSALAALGAKVFSDINEPLARIIS